MKQIAFVTGSSRGIGKAIALYLAKSGYSIILHGSKLTESLQETEKELKKIGAHVMTVCFDISSKTAVEESCTSIIKVTGGVDVLVNNAGIVKDRSFIKMSVQDWDDVIKTNLYGPFYITKQLLPKMIEQSYGRIINISSIAIRGAFGKTNYAAAKAGLIGMTKSLALEVAKNNITVNAICPGFIKTDMSLAIPEKYQKQLLAQVALGRPGSGAEVASIIGFLAGRESAYITGAVIDINGGWL